MKLNKPENFSKTAVKLKWMSSNQMGAYSLNETKNKTLIFGKNFIFIMLLLIIPAFNIIIPGPSCSKGRHIHWTNLPDTCQLGSDLSAGLRYQNVWITVTSYYIDTTYFIENFGEMIQISQKNGYVPQSTHKSALEKVVACAVGIFTWVLKLSLQCVWNK